MEDDDEEETDNEEEEEGLDDETDDEDDEADNGESSMDEVLLVDSKFVGLYCLLFVAPVLFKFELPFTMLCSKCKLLNLLMITPAGVVVV